MIDAGVEFHFGRLEWILYGEVHVDQESASCIRALCGSLEPSDPFVNVVLLGLDTDTIDGFLGEVGEFFANSF